MEASGKPVRFQPRTLPNRRRRTLLLVLGPLTWLAALIVVAVVARRTEAIGYALEIAIGSLILALLILLPGAIMRRRRLRGGTQ